LPIGLRRALVEEKVGRKDQKNQIKEISQVERRIILGQRSAKNSEKIGEVKRLDLIADDAALKDGEENP
jgi:hypothetical protein